MVTLAFFKLGRDIRVEKNDSISSAAMPLPLLSLFRFSHERPNVKAINHKHNVKKSAHGRNKTKMID